MEEVLGSFLWFPLHLGPGVLYFNIRSFIQYKNYPLEISPLSSFSVAVTGSTKPFEGVTPPPSDLRMSLAP